MVIKSSGWSARALYCLLSAPGYPRLVTVSSSLTVPLVITNIWARIHLNGLVAQPRSSVASTFLGWLARTTSLEEFASSVKPTRRNNRSHSNWLSGSTSTLVDHPHFDQPRCFPSNSQSLFILWWCVCDNGNLVGKSMKRRYDTIVIVTAWSIWKERNNRVLNNRSKSWAEVTAAAAEELKKQQYWRSARGKANRVRLPLRRVPSLPPWPPPPSPPSATRTTSTPVPRRLRRRATGTGARRTRLPPRKSGAYKVVKEGFVLLQFAPAVATRQYDWTRKQVFSLSVWEMGSLLTLGPTDSCEFFHDPFKGRSDEGKVRKVLKVEPTPDGNSRFFNLSVQNRLLNIDENIYIPITKGEFAVIVSTFNYIIPHLMG
uniref:Uncharacterized protein n=1 Tax=Oryza meridionalis TaxID=40149 RepID=A0A0E0EBE0_9ORYZ